MKRRIETNRKIWPSFPGSSDSKESACNVGELGLILDGDPLKKGMATHSSILAGEFHGQRRLVGYSPWDHKELDKTERLTLWNP